MARGVNYDKKIEELNKKIAANKEAAKKLDEEKRQLLADKQKVDLQDLVDCMDKTGMTVDELLKIVNSQKNKMQKNKLKNKDTSTAIISDTGHRSVFLMGSCLHGRSMQG